MQNTVLAFTVSYKGLTNVLGSWAEISEAFNPVSSSQPPSRHKYNAIWDTGATGTAITQKVADDCALKPIGMAIVQTAKGQMHTLVFLANIYLPQNVCIYNLRVTLTDIRDADVLIGMDIISLGDFAVTNTNGKTTFSFRVPSVQEIDFIPDTQEHNVMDSGNRKQRRAFQAKKRKGLI